MDVASDKVNSKAAELTKNMNDMGHRAVDKATEKADQLRESAADLYEKGSAQAGQLQDNVEQYVRDQPFKSILIAAGAGILLGMFLSSRK